MGVRNVVHKLAIMLKRDNPISPLGFNGRCGSVGKLDSGYGPTFLVHQRQIKYA